MNINKIKKDLYKQKPTARLRYIRLGVAYYYAILKTEVIVDRETTMNPIIIHDTITEQDYAGYDLQFEIPVNDMGSVDFLPEMEAKHLIRWLADDNKPSGLSGSSGTKGSD